MNGLQRIMMNTRQGKRLAVYVEGREDAPVIMLSNSLGTDHGMWQAQVDAFKDRFRIVRYDTRGHGASDVIEDSSLQNLGEDVIDILDALNIGQTHFCGISMGGITALWLAIHYPQRLLSITVANSAAKIWTQEGWNARADAVEQNGLAELVATTHTRWFGTQFDYARDALAQQAIRSLADTAPQGYAQSCRALANADVRNQLGRITIPTLIITGCDDPVTTVADGEFMQQRIRRSELVTIEAFHLSNIEQPEPFNQVFGQFIGSIQ